MASASKGRIAIQSPAIALCCLVLLFLIGTVFASLCTDDLMFPGIHELHGQPWIYVCEYARLHKALDLAVIVGGFALSVQKARSVKRISN
jgi:hypothetical protein